ncbi:MAG: cytochrome b/b6 domain-containing protein [Thiobacillus sp.]
MSQANTTESTNSTLYQRHPLAIRVMHWINVIAFSLLLMSGLQIFNAHPALNWGKSSYTGQPPLLQMGALRDAQGQLVGVTRIFGHTFDTTGVLGVSTDANGRPGARGFPAWMTVPGAQWLSMARRWHFFFAWLLLINGVAYLLYALASRHLTRDLTPTCRDWRSLGQSIKDHVRFRHPRGDEARRYNILQKLAYLSVIFGFFPLIIVAGLAMSPGLNALLPGWIDIFGGRQSARTVHFIAAWALVAFVFIHVFEVMVSGLWNNLRSIITGRYRVPVKEVDHANH